jgi:hypothetical protein
MIELKNVKEKILFNESLLKKAGMRRRLNIGCALMHIFL